MKWIDLPPVWLAAALALAWAGRGSPLLDLFEPAQMRLGYGLVFCGAAFMVLAIWEMRKARTTVIPHQQPDALVTRGIFSWSRNPIYLGDALILTGLSVAWQSVVGLILVPVFVWIIHTRFVRPEEARLEASFGDAFRDYKARVRRW